MSTQEWILYNTSNRDCYQFVDEYIIFLHSGLRVHLEDLRCMLYVFKDDHTEYKSLDLSDGPLFSRNILDNKDYTYLDSIGGDYTYILYKEELHCITIINNEGYIVYTLEFDIYAIHDLYRR